MKYFLDTNICAYIINCKFKHLNGRFIKCAKDELKISSVVLFELLYGAEKSQRREINLAEINKLINGLEIVTFDAQAAEIAGKIRADLERAGKVIGINDIMIAATALAHGGIIITNNSREFSRVEELSIEDWSAM